MDTRRNLRHEAGEQSEDYVLGYGVGYRRGKADSKGAALQNIADTLVMLTYVKCLEFTNGPGDPSEVDVEIVGQLEDYLFHRLPAPDGRHNAREDNGGCIETAKEAKKAK